MKLNQISEVLMHGRFFENLELTKACKRFKRVQLQGPSRSCREVFQAPSKNAGKFLV